MATFVYSEDDKIMRRTENYVAHDRNQIVRQIRKDFKIPKNKKLVDYMIDTHSSLYWEGYLGNKDELTAQ